MEQLKCRKCSATFSTQSKRPNQPQHCPACRARVRDQNSPASQSDAEAIEQFPVWLSLVCGTAVVILVGVFLATVIGPLKSLVFCLYSVAIGVGIWQRKRLPAIAERVKKQIGGITRNRVSPPVRAVAGVPASVPHDETSAASSRRLWQYQGRPRSFRITPAIHGPFNVKEMLGMLADGTIAPTATLLRQGRGGVPNKTLIEELRRVAYSQYVCKCGSYLQLHRSMVGNKESCPACEESYVVCECQRCGAIQPLGHEGDVYLLDHITAGRGIGPYGRRESRYCFLNPRTRHISLCVECYRDQISMVNNKGATDVSASGCVIEVLAGIAVIGLLSSAVTPQVRAVNVGIAICIVPLAWLFHRWWGGSRPFANVPTKALCHFAESEEENGLTDMPKLSRAAVGEILQIKNIEERSSGMGSWGVVQSIRAFESEADRSKNQGWGPDHLR